jgi:hypothetical protein
MVEGEKTKVGALVSIVRLQVSEYLDNLYIMVLKPDENNLFCQPFDLHRHIRRHVFRVCLQIVRLHFFTLLYEPQLEIFTHLKLKGHNFEI